MPLLCHLERRREMTQAGAAPQSDTVGLFHFSFCTFHFQFALIIFINFASSMKGMESFRASSSLLPGFSPRST